ncbi:uncharacterized protein LOC128553539 [Mercenaria mercenaria]|uniref:uncharacterized protein LOC128553539 n=1 Tax=Mercenaria mercenaria TaxID=6596 RepID=UPI00234F3353|nr:uncharacterized protein LOC128553539 [Mercenaria mercenaria]
MEREKQELLLRLSQLSESNLTYNRFSDDKRPTKLAEEFSELFSNEWTDVFEDMPIEDAKEKTTTMLELLYHANRLCNDLSTDHMRKIQRSFCSLTFRNTVPAEEGKTETYIEGADGRTTDTTVISAGRNDLDITKEVSDEVPGRLALVIFFIRFSVHTSQILIFILPFPMKYLKILIMHNA